MIDEIRAEYLLTKLYPELDDQWVARHKGTFYRNYSQDAMHIYPEERLVELSRDSFLKLLPDTFLSNEDELAKGVQKESKEELKRRLHRLDEAFMPIDTQRFKTHIQLERAIDPILNMKLQYILQEYFDYDLKAEQNEYIAQVAPLLPYASLLRGDLYLIRNIMEVVTHHKVQHQVTNYSCDDNTKFSMPMVLITVREDNLRPDEYKVHQAKLEEFLHFLTERFLPFDMLFKIRVIGKQPEQGETKGNEPEQGDKQDIILLEYNSWTTTQEYAGQRA